MLALLEARYELFFGDLDLASEKIQELLKQEPFLIYEDLLYAELLTIQEKFQGAEDILNQIIEDDKNSLWVRNEAIDLLAKINR